MGFGGNLGAGLLQASQAIPMYQQLKAKEDDDLRQREQFAAQQEMQQKQLDFQRDQLKQQAAQQAQGNFFNMWKSAPEGLEVAPGSEIGQQADKYGLLQRQLPGALEQGLQGPGDFDPSVERATLRVPAETKMALEQVKSQRAMQAQQMKNAAQMQLMEVRRQIAMAQVQGANNRNLADLQMAAAALEEQIRYHDNAINAANWRDQNGPDTGDVMGGLMAMLNRQKGAPGGPIMPTKPVTQPPVPRPANPNIPFKIQPGAPAGPMGQPAASNAPANDPYSRYLARQK